MLVFGPGTGELVAVRAPPDDWLIVDGCGARRTHYGVELLRGYGTRPKMVVLTHPHADHAKGVPELVEEVAPLGDPAPWPLLGLVEPPAAPGAGQLSNLQAHWEGGNAEQAVAAMLERWDRRPACAWRLAPGDVRPLGTAEVRVLGPEDSARKAAVAKWTKRRDFDPNRVAAALEIRWDDRRLVLGSDLEEAKGRGWTAAHKREPALPTHDGFKLAHHGSKGAHLHRLFSARNAAPLRVTTPFASRNLPPHDRDSPLALLTRAGRKVHLTALPASYDQQVGAPRRLSLARFKKPAGGFRPDPKAPGFPDCYVIASFPPGGGRVLLRYGPGSVLVGA